MAKYPDWAPRKKKRKSRPDASRRGGFFSYHVRQSSPCMPRMVFNSFSVRGSAASSMALLQ